MSRNRSFPVVFLESVARFCRLLLFPAAVVCVLAFPVQAASNDVDAATADNSLIMSYGDYSTEPFVRIIDDQLAGGLMVDIGQELSRRLGVPIRYRQSARKRLESDLANGLSHINCLINPAWMDSPDVFDWTLPLYRDRDVVVAPADQLGRYSEAQDVIGHTVGTTLGFKYPGTIGKLLRANQADRVDVVTIQQGLTLLDRNRVDLLLNSEMRLYASLQTMGLREKIKFTGIIESSYSFFCAVSRLSPVPFPQINRSIDAMIADGFFQQMESKYRGF